MRTLPMQKKKHKRKLPGLQKNPKLNGLEGKETHPGKLLLLTLNKGGGIL